MIWGRSELEALGRDELLAHARRLGIVRPELMTRTELIEELLLAPASEDIERRVARTLLGKARDLVARVMDLGLHLPDAAQRLRNTPPIVDQTPPPPLPTVALAEVYAAQGHGDQALAIVDELLARNPSHQDALRLRDRLTRDPHSTDPPASPTPPSQEPDPRPRSPGLPRASQLRAVFDDNVVRLAWSVRPLAFASRRAARGGGRLVLRVVSVTQGVPEPLVRTIDTEIDTFTGVHDIKLEAEPSSICAAVGLRYEGGFDALGTAT
jgi:hypothetical protein